MTRKLIWVLILVAIAGALAFAQNAFPGTVSIEWFSYQMNVSIYLFLILCLVGFTLFFWLWRMYRGMVALPGRLSGWREEKREERGLAALQTATIALHEGRWLHAEKAAKIAGRKPSAAPMAALIGVASAHARKDTSAVNDWLSQLDAHPEFADAKLLQQAQMALDSNDASSASALLEKASPNIRKHSLRYKELLIAAQAQANNWQGVQQLASERKTTLSIENKNAWMKQAIAGLSADSNQSVEDLRKLYKAMPEDVRDDDASIQTLAQAFMWRDAHADARRVIQESMRNRWRPTLLNDYVNAAQSNSITEQLKMCQAWQAQGHNDAALSLVTGQLCLRANMWGQAKKNFEDTIRNTPSASAYSGLAQALRGMGDETAAQAAERQASEAHGIKALN